MKPYKEITRSQFGIDYKQIVRISDNSFIPPDPMNSDYREYLQWLAEGNTPDIEEPVVDPQITILPSLVSIIS